MYYGSNRATAIALSTMLLALFLASSFASIPTVHGQIGATVSPKDYPVFCDSTGNFTITINTASQKWYGVAIEIPKDFKGLADGDVSDIYAPDITYQSRFMAVYDESLYYPYTRDYYWVQICAPTAEYSAWHGITSTAAAPVTITITGVTAPSVARDYTVSVYYTFTNFACTYRPLDEFPPLDFSDGNRGFVLPSVTVRVHMREEASKIEGFVRDTSYATGGELTAGYVTATAADGPLKGKVVAKTTITSTGTYSLTGLYNGTYKLTAWGKIAKVGTLFAYTPTDLALPVTVGRKAALSGVNIAVNRGGEISGNVRLYDGVTAVSPSTVFGTSFAPGTEADFTSPNAYLPVRIELVDANGTIVAKTTVYVRSTALYAAYSLKELDTPYEYGGIPAGTYKLKAYAFGFIQTADVSVSVTAPGGVTIDIPIVKGGGVQGTLYYVTPQGVSTTLASGENILVEIFDAAGALKGVWIGTTVGTQSSTTFLIRGTGDTIKPVGVAGHSTVWLKTYAGRGVKDYGLADGGYTVKVSVRGLVQPTPYPTAVISYAALGSVSIYLKTGGSIGGFIYSKDPTGVYAENWRTYETGSPLKPAWDYTGDANTRIRAYVYDAAGAEVGFATMFQLTTTDKITLGPFTGRARSTASLQSGYKQTALADGTYTVRIFTYGYWLPTPYPTATIYSGGAVSVEPAMRRGGTVGGLITFREAGIIIPGGITGMLKVEAVDAAGVTRGVSFYRITTAVQTQTYTIYGLYKYGTALDGGIVDGAYTVKATLKNFAHPTQTVTVAGGSSATANFDAYRMGSVTGTIRGAVTYQSTPIRMSWVKITLATAAASYTTYSAEGTYSISVPDGTYTMTFSAFGYKPYTVTVTISSGATQVISADLVESFERIPEFPLGAILTLATALGLALYLMRWTRKPITPKL